MAVVHHSEGWVRTEEAPRLPPPPSMRGVKGWMIENLFSTPLYSLLTVVGAAFAIWVIAYIGEWALVHAVWTGSGREDCVAPAQQGLPLGACWPFVWAKFPQWIYGFYPFSERWRPTLVYILFFALLVPLLTPRVPFKRLNAILFFVVFPIIGWWLLYGGFGLPVVETSQWGGLLVTMVVAVTGIVASLPLGILLALGRRSKMPIVKFLSVVFIEVWRGVPLITVLFMASVMLPLFLPAGTSFDKLLRCLIGIALFSAAYMAEVVRGGLQAIPKGQYEGAMALGISYWKMMLLIILPQALKIVIPGIVNSFISLFKDTTLVLIIGIFDLLGIVGAGIADGNWASPQTGNTGYFAVAIMYWVFCFGMSRYSIYMEQRLHTGHRR